jgi:hypothetical protein
MAQLVPSNSGLAVVQVSKCIQGTQVHFDGFSIQVLRIWAFPEDPSQGQWSEALSVVSIWIPFHCKFLLDLGNGQIIHSLCEVSLLLSPG